MQRWSRAVALGVVVLTCGPRSTNVAEAFSLPATGAKHSMGTGIRGGMTISTMITTTRRSENVAPLCSIRTGGAGTPGMDDDKTGYGPELIQDPDASMSPEEWEAKYGEEVDTMVLYDEKVRAVVNRWMWLGKGVVFWPRMGIAQVSCFPTEHALHCSMHPTNNNIQHLSISRTWSADESTPSVWPSTWT